MQIQAKKDAMRQVQDGTWRIGFTVLPEDVPIELMTAPMGTIYNIAIVNAEDEAHEAVYEEVKFEKPKRNFEDLPPSNQAALLCERADFQFFLIGYNTLSGAEIAADEIRHRCGVKSRSELDKNPVALAEFRKIQSEFSAWQIEQQYKDELSRF